MTTAQAVSRLTELRDQRNEARRAYERAAKAFGVALAGTDIPASRIASELGISRQAVYQLRDKWEPFAVWQRQQEAKRRFEVDAEIDKWAAIRPTNKGENDE